MHRERTDPISTPNAATELRNDRRHQFLKEITDAIPQPKGEPPPSPPSEQSANPRSAAINISVGDALSTVPEATEQRVRRRERIRIGDRPPTPNRMSATNSQRINRVRRAQRGGPKSWSSRHRTGPPLSISAATPSERRRPAPPTDGRCRRVCASKIHDISDRAEVVRSQQNVMCVLCSIHRLAPTKPVKQWTSERAMAVA